MENKLPEGWEWKKLGEIAEKIHYGYTASAVEKEIGPKLLRITDIQDNSVDWESVPFCEIEEKDKEKYLLHEGDLVFARTGATVGKSYLLEGNVPDSVFASYLIRVILSDIVVKKYVYYFFQSSSYWLQIQSGKVGAGQPNVNATKLSEITLPIPPLEIQQKIVSILEKAEETKKLRAQADELTQKLLQSVFLEMFGDSVENPNNWKVKQLKDCIKIPLNSGWSPKCSDDIGGTPVFSLANLQDQGLSDEITKYYSGDLPKKGLDLEIGDLLISRSNTVELVGRIGRYNGKPEKVIYPDLMIRIRLNENLVNSLFFEKCMQLNSTRKLIQKVSHGTSGSMVKISQSSLLKLSLILPPIELQQKFAEICNQIENTTESQIQSSIEINNLFNALMQKAFTGELVS